MLDKTFLYSGKGSNQTFDCGLYSLPLIFLQISTIDLEYVEVLTSNILKSFKFNETLLSQNPNSILLTILSSIIISSSFSQA